VSVCTFVCWSQPLNCAKTTEPVEMPFRVWTWVGPRNHVVGRGLDPPGKGAVLGASPIPL